jgi:hypothetical protein
MQARQLSTPCVLCSMPRGMHDERGGGTAIQARRSHDAFGRDASELLRAFRRIGFYRRWHGFPARGAARHIFGIHQAIVDKLPQHGVEHRYVGARPHREP